MLLRRVVRAARVLDAKCALVQAALAQNFDGKKRNGLEQSSFDVLVYVYFAGAVDRVVSEQHFAKRSITIVCDVGAGSLGASCKAFG